MEENFPELKDSNFHIAQCNNLLKHLSLEHQITKD